ncbi:1-(5-phosphoribosyl)-5-[(5-phosphoribosylamino)methylideneamino] imidazole-4-carboxamide isomerase [Candidatus Thorarchaeota archaeon]|nr:MAG: 1-(5-phosphoribosyl)-5-[(5-phosphoribosylamino)methylideneamino] imidazole-4-carboxamide isomerase [Candidatus Thorarchaeota archaeon]
MRIYPAIDLMKGFVVRLKQGKPSQKITYNKLETPIDVAKRWEEQGAEMLHIVDLDAALNDGNNLSTIKSIVKAIDIPVQAGGGFRNETIISTGIDMGIDRIILGSLALQDPNQVLKIGNTFGFDKIVVSLDYNHDTIATHGWQTFENKKVSPILDMFRAEGICNFLLTSIERDGSLKGPDSGLVSISDFLGDIIVAGGVSNLSDIRFLAKAGFSGAIIGRALYESRVNLSKAIEVGRSSL